METPTPERSPTEPLVQAPNREEASIAPDTTRRSLIHWVVRYDGQNWFRNVGVYAASVICTYGLMALVAAAQIHSVTKICSPLCPPTPIYMDWPVMFAFLVSFPAILFFVASDQKALDRAMDRVWAAGVVTQSKEFVDDFKKDWKDSFTTINLTVQILGLLASIPLSYLTFYAFETVGAWTWAQATPVNGYAYMAGIAMFYALLMTYIIRSVAMTVLLKDVANEWLVALSPLHPDGCGGLRPLGRLGLRNQYALSILGINIAVVGITLHHISASLAVTIVVPALAVYLIFGPIIFLGPLLPFRGVMGDRRRAMMQVIAAPLEAKFDSLMEQARVGGAVSKQELDELERLRSVGTTVGEMPIWPFDARTMRLFATAYVIPVLVTLATKLGELLVDHASK